MITSKLPPSSLLLLFISALISHSCKTEPIALDFIDPTDKEIELSTGFTENIILIEGNAWQIEDVRIGVDEQVLFDKKGAPMKLAVEDLLVTDADDILTLQRMDGDLAISLKENFSDLPRVIRIGLAQNSHRDVIMITQRKGSAYRIVDVHFDDNEEEHLFYSGKEDCQSISLFNPNPGAQWMSTDGIFEQVTSISHFQSAEYGTFDWITEEAPFIQAPDFLTGGKVIWTGLVKYQSEADATPFVGEGKTTQSILVESHTRVNLDGDIIYADRTVDYTLTVENEGSGHRFTVHGTWHQKIPYTPTVHINDTY